MFRVETRQNGFQAALRTVDLIYHNTVRAVRRGHSNAVIGLLMNIFQMLVMIAVFYALFHTAYIGRLHELLDGGTLAGLSAQQYAQLRSGLQAAEQTGLQPDHFDPTLLPYLGATYAASQHAYIVVFLAVSAVGVLGAVATGWLVRRPT